MIGKTISLECENLFEIFEKNLNRNADSVLIEPGTVTSSYDQLNGLIGNIYARVRVLNIEKGDVVSLFIPNGIKRVACVLALCKLGITFVPLDPLLTKAKIEHILGKSKAKFVIVGDDNNYRSVWKAYGSEIVHPLYLNDLLVSTNSTQGNKMDMNGATYDKLVTLSDIFIILPTSGSTGNPKLVPVSHGNMINRFTWYWDEFPFDKNEVTCSKTNFIFFDWITETFSSILQNQSCLFLQTNDVLDTEIFVNYLRKYSVTRLVTVPNLLMAIIKEKHAKKKKDIGLRNVTCGSDMLLTKLVSDFLQAFPTAILTNVFGCTETGGDNIYKVFTNSKDINLKEENAAIGYPMPNTRVVLWDEDGQEINEPNVTGEIVISGLSVSPGYLDFCVEDIEDKFPKNHPAILLVKHKMFRTCDFGYRSEKDGFVTIGRKDHMVKIRGQKVNLAEVECAIKYCFPELDSFVTSKFITSSATTKIFAFCVVGNDTIIRGKDITVKIKQRLPRYMLPKIILIPSLPLNPISRKIDRLKLQNMIEVERSLIDVLPCEQVQAMSKSDQLLYITSQVLDVHLIPDDINASFFDLGGDSGTLVRFMKELNSFGFSADIQQILEAESLACLLRSENSLVSDTDATNVCDYANFISFMNLAEGDLESIADGFTKQIVESEPFAQHYQDTWDIKDIPCELSKYAYKHYPEYCYAVKINDRFVGGIVSHPAHMELIDLNAYPEGLRAINIEAITEILGKLFQNNYKVLFADFLFVDSSVESKQRVSVVLKFYELFIDIARQNDFNAIVSIMSAPALQAMASVLGHTIEKEINVSEFKLENGERPFAKFDKNYKLLTAVKYL